MGDAIANEILHIPGQLIAGPTDLSPGAAPDFGGTVLGNTADIVLRVVHRDLALRAEEYGNEIVEVLEGAEDVSIGCFLRGFDEDSLPKVLDGTVSTLTGKPVVNFPGVTRASSFASDRSFVLLFAPDNFENHPAILMYKAIPLIEDLLLAELQNNVSGEFGVPAIFRGIRDGSDRVARLALMEDLTL